MFLIVEDDARPVGCGGVRRIDDLEGLVTYEVKHVWARPDLSLAPATMMGH